MGALSHIDALADLVDATLGEHWDKFGRILGLRRIDGHQLAHELGALAYQVAPSFVPILATARLVIAVHVFPGTPFQNGAVVTIDRDEQQARWLSGSLATLPRALIPLVMPYKPAATRAARVAALDALSTRFAGAPLPDSLRELAMSIDVTRWTPREPAEDALWASLRIDHPYLGFPWPSIRARASDAWQGLVDHALAEPGLAPELVALVLSCALRASQPIDRRLLLRLLRAESMREARFSATGRWRARVPEYGLVLWNEVFGSMREHSDLLSGSCFSPLARFPELFSGRSLAAIQCLEEVAEHLAQASHLSDAVVQARNALHLRAFQCFPAAVARGRLAAICEAADSGGYSALVVRATSKAARQGEP